MLKNEKQLKLPEKKTETNAGKKTDKMLKNNDTIPYHPNKYTDSELFLENLTQYTIHTH